MVYTVCRLFIIFEIYFQILLNQMLYGTKVQIVIDLYIKS